MKKGRDLSLIISVAVLLSVLRFMIRNSLYITEIMAIFNLIALNYSVWSMFNDAEKKLSKKNQNAQVGKEILKNNEKLLRRIRMIVQVVLFFVCALIYLCLMRGATGNDILSILALCFALETNSISDNISAYCYKKT